MAVISKKERPGKMRLIDATGYRLPLAAYVSILHRASGLLMFVLLPFIVWMMEGSLSSEASYAKFVAVFHQGAFGVPGVFFKVIVLALIWAYLHHLIAGVRHLWMDMTHSVSKQQGQWSAVVTLLFSVALTVLLGLKLFGAF